MWVMKNEKTLDLWMLVWYTIDRASMVWLQCRRSFFKLVPGLNGAHNSLFNGRDTYVLQGEEKFALLNAGAHWRVVVMDIQLVDTTLPVSFSFNDASRCCCRLLLQLRQQWDVRAPSLQSRGASCRQLAVHTSRIGKPVVDDGARHAGYTRIMRDAKAIRGKNSSRSWNECFQFLAFATEWQERVWPTNNKIHLIRQLRLAILTFFFLSDKKEERRMESIPRFVSRKLQVKGWLSLTFSCFSARPLSYTSSLDFSSVLIAPGRPQVGPYPCRSSWNWRTSRNFLRWFQPAILVSWAELFIM